MHDPTDPVRHWIHPDDLPLARAMVVDLVKGRTEAWLRLRTTDRGWRRVHVEAHLVLLDSSTTAALRVRADSR